MSWGAMLRHAGSLGLSPEGFWRLSLPEWRMLTAPAQANTPMSRAEFDRLAAEHLDQTPASQEDHR